jgi:hypothetical protein
MDCSAQVVCSDKCSLFDSLFGPTTNTQVFRHTVVKYYTHTLAIYKISYVMYKFGIPPRWLA